MAKEKHDRDENLGTAADRSQSPALPQAPGDIFLDRPEAPPPVLRPTRSDYGQWYRKTVVETFASLAANLFDGLFGPPSFGAVHVRVATDLSFEFRTVELGGKWQRAESPWFLREQSPPSTTQIIRSEFKKGFRVAVLLHYRPRDAELFGFVGESVSAESHILAFENERMQRFSALTEAEKRDVEQLDSRFFEIDDPPDDFREHIDAFLSAPNEILRELAAEAINSTVPTTARLDWEHWPQRTKAIREVFRRLGGDLTFAVALVPENWQDRWVTPKHEARKLQVEVPSSIDELAPPRILDIKDLMSIRSAAEQLGIDKTVIQDGIAAKKVNAYKLGDGTITVSLAECRHFRDHKRNPPGRPRKDR